MRVMCQLGCLFNFNCVWWEFSSNTEPPSHISTIYLVVPNSSILFHFIFTGWMTFHKDPQIFHFIPPSSTHYLPISTGWPKFSIWFHSILTGYMTFRGDRRLFQSIPLYSTSYIHRWFLISILDHGPFIIPVGFTEDSMCFPFFAHRFPCRSVVLPFWFHFIPGADYDCLYGSMVVPV